MKNITKKVMIYSLVGLLQIGIGASIGASITEASPRSDWQHEQNDRRWQENNRHKQEMKRRDKESDRAWDDRQWRENQTHDQIVRQIEADIIMMFLN